MDSTAEHSVSVAGIVLDAHRVLLIQRRDNGHWEPPGGVLEVDESVTDGLRREIHEETGATVDVQALTGVYKNLTRGIIALVFRCTLLTPPLSATAEAQKIAWHPVDGVREIMDEAFAIRVLDAAQSAPHPAVRSHDGRHLLPS